MDSAWHGTTYTTERSKLVRSSEGLSDIREHSFSSNWGRAFGSLDSFLRLAAGRSRESVRVPSSKAATRRPRSASWKCWGLIL